MRLQFSVCLVAVVTMLSAWSSVAPAQQQNVLDVGNRSQLLADPDLIYDSTRVSFTLHPANKHVGGPLIHADQPWEGWYVSAFAGTVLFDEQEKLFKTWYTCPADSAYFDDGGTCYAISRDGLHWEKPLVGTRQAKNGKPHNSVTPLLCPSVFKDSDDPDPQRRYKMIGFDPHRGYLAMLSPDGLRWKEQSPRPIVPISYVDDVISAFRDRRDGRFVALPKMMTPVFGRQRRSIYLSSSPDFVYWSKPEPAFFADRRDDVGSLVRVERVRPLLNYADNFNVMRTEFYGAGAYSAESCAIGFPWVFTINANVPKANNQEGPIETQFAVSRDLEHWSRPFRTPVIAPGKPGEWDAGMVLTNSQAIDVGDEVRLYYSGANYTHGAPVLYGSAVEQRGVKYTTAIGLATWKRDRFVSADAQAEGGTLTTVPLRFTGKRLEINARTKDRGEIRVELLDAAGQLLTGVRISSAMRGDALRSAVHFDDLPDLSSLAGRPISLRFHLQDAELFSFAFRD